MSGLRLFASNKLENLSAELCKNFDFFDADLLKSHSIIVQSKGMQKWLSLQIAENLPVCANIDFCFPSHFISKLFSQFNSDFSKDFLLDKEIIFWKLFKNIKEDSFSNIEILSSYLADGNTELKAYQFSRKLAHLFDQYIFYRPEMIKLWENQKDTSWQSQLFYQIASDGNFQHMGKVKNSFMQHLSSGQGIEKLPKQINIFGISYMTLFHLEIFRALSAFSEVNFYCLNPCAHYWFDIVAAKYESEELYFESGNDLLSFLGQLGKEFLFNLYKDCSEDISIFTEPPRQTLLSCIQNDIFNLANNNEKHEIAEFDDSIQVHSVHSKMREIEVLYQYLLSCFEKDKDLEAKDIIVMAPDIEEYVPHIEANFELEANNNSKIAYSISDNSYSSCSELVQAIFMLFAFEKARFTSQEVMDFLETRSVRIRFGLSLNEIIIIKDLVCEAKIFWGINGDFKRKFKLPTTKENTWESGKNRLIQLFNERKIIIDEKEVSLIQAKPKLIDSFNKYLDKLFFYTEKFNHEKTVSSWLTLFREILDEFFEVLDNEADVKENILAIFNKLEDNSTKTAFIKELNFETMFALFKDELNNEKAYSGFLSRGITFCSLLPLRSIPAKVICLIGMDAGKYPRLSQKLSFDLMAKKRFVCDRDRKRDDSYIFLESLLSARNKLFISYQGQDVKDNSMKLPSGLVDNILDYIESNYFIKDRILVESIFYKHPISSFSSLYFHENSKFINYSVDSFNIARELISQHTSDSNILGEIEFPEIGKSFEELDLKDLVNFYSNPSKHFLNKRFNIYLELKNELLSEVEPLRLESLSKYKVLEKLLKSIVDLNEEDNRYENIKTMGLLPHGEIGKACYANLGNSVSIIKENIKKLNINEKRPDIQFELSINKLKIKGSLSSIYNIGQVSFPSGKISQKYILKAFINHLFLCMSNETEVEKETYIITEEKIIKLNKITDPKKVLDEFISIYLKGMCIIIPFFPEASYRYANAIIKGENEQKAVNSVRKFWMNNYQEYSEANNIYYKKFFNNFDFNNNNFKDISLKIFKPIYEIKEDIKL
ncbi:MAG: exodeoxyribonuclease V subunit gamma [Pseudomonadota bacterium]